MSDPANQASAAARRAKHRNESIPNVVRAGQPIGHCPDCDSRFDYSRGTDVHNLDKCPRCGSDDWYKWGYRYNGDEIRRDQAWDRYDPPPSVRTDGEHNARQEDTETNQGEQNHE
jgi:predicted  nucleic acid-binding Zn-ribbon protein